MGLFHPCIESLWESHTDGIHEHFCMAHSPDFISAHIDCMQTVCNSGANRRTKHQTQISPAADDTTTLLCRHGQQAGCKNTLSSLHVASMIISVELQIASRRHEAPCDVRSLRQIPVADPCMLLTRTDATMYFLADINSR